MAPLFEFFSDTLLAVCLWVPLPLATDLLLTPISWPLELWHLGPL